MSQFIGEESSTEHEASGLARDIRSVVVSEQFDLGGYTEQRAKDLLHAAFKTPLPAPTEMIRITLVVGGGKLVRQRYPEDLPKWVMSALRELGFTEDKSAAETFDSQGTFKHQHDTGQNLKYVIVYPHVACAKRAASSADESSSGNETIDQSSPEYIVTACEMSTFQEILSSKVHSYNQKKKLLKLLQAKLEEFTAISNKLISGEKLSTKEQFLYDNNPENTQEKINVLQNLIKEMVDHGQLTNKEKLELVKNIESNIQSLNQEIEIVKTENKPKKLEKLEEKRQSSLQRKLFVEKLSSPLQPRLQFGDDIRKIYMKLFPLYSLEEKERNMSLTMADLKLLEEKSDFETQIKELQAKSKGWFEDDSDFQERCAFEESEAKRVYKQRQAEKKPNKPSSSSSSASKSTVSKTGAPTSAWTTVAKKGSIAASNLAKPAKKPTSGFAAAFDSDDD